MYGIIVFVIGVVVISCVGIVFMALGAQEKEMQTGWNISLREAPPGTGSGQRSSRDNQSPEMPPKDVSVLYGDKEIMNRAKDLRRLYGKEVYVKFLKGKARELGIDDFSLRVDDVL